MHLYLIIFDCALLGVAAGLIYGIFGGGSGLILAPGFYYVLRHFDVSQGHRMQIAIATTAAVSVILGIFSTRVQARQKNMSLVHIKKMGLGLTLGCLAAVLLLNIIPSVFIKHLFGVVVIIVALWMWFYRSDLDRKHWPIDTFSHYLWSFLIGLLWFLFGVAVFTVPYLHKTGLDIRRSVGTATLTSTLFSALGSILFMLTGYFKIGASINHIGYVNLLLGACAVIPSAIFGHFGSVISYRLPQKILKKAYALLIVAVGVLMLI